MVLTVGRRGCKSSTRVGFVAPLGNTKEDDYYRNDSPVGDVWLAYCWRRRLTVGGGLLKYCRHKKKRKRRGRRSGSKRLYSCSVGPCVCANSADILWATAPGGSAAYHRQNIARPGNPVLDNHESKGVEAHGWDLLRCSSMFGS
ncbi:hypothetical protein B0H67DRAFT_264691 [Lasiosphaeris hirsuta]|uniref:Uncharacterized protein n=1 Tax=Lasiosphaeris hirsuta TaxID=260670 RepID=A0AA40DRN3_9PEZI|nr:hypothetical protein B0H67DRAFT_264691 [Lasiosphaeris hirsuta]